MGSFETVHCLTRSCTQGGCEQSSATSARTMGTQRDSAGKGLSVGGAQSLTTCWCAQLEGAKALEYVHLAKGTRLIVHSTQVAQQSSQQK